MALIAVVSALAGGLPARRASNVDPMEALRQQYASEARAAHPADELAIMAR